MLAALLTTLVLTAPDADAAKKLRVAWASQYEWKEHGIKNVTLDLEYSGYWTERGGQEFPFEGNAQVVVVGTEIERRHYPGVSERLRPRLDDHIRWILARFVRKPFEEEFKGASFKGAEGAGGTLKVTAGRRVLIVKDDRIVAEERDIGARGKPYVVRVNYDTGAVGGGYTITGETCGFTRRAVKTTWSRVLEMKEGAEPPAPAGYVYKRSGRSKSEMRIEITQARFDLDDPVVLDPKARDLLKTAWERRYVLPAEIRLEGTFQRKVDKDLARARWISDLRGQYQVWGMDKISVALDERLRDRSWAAEVERTCNEHVKGFFELLQPRAFEEEFKGCGFEAAMEGNATVVSLYGHPKVLGFRVENEAITARLDNDGRPGWWDFKVKAQRDGRVLIAGMTREIEGKKFDLKFRYGRSKGIQVPKQFDVVGVPRDRRAGAAMGVATYVFKRTKVTLPKN